MLVATSYGTDGLVNILEVTDLEFVHRADWCDGPGREGFTSGLQW